MRKAVLAFSLALAIGSGQCSPSLVRAPKPDRTLTLLGKYAVAGDRRKLYVTVIEHNITKHSISAGRDIQPMSWYHMKVLRDGEPAPKTLLLQEFLAPNTTGIYAGSELLETVPPKGQVSFDVHLELYFDLSAPGKYEITFDNGVETSNTLVGRVTETGGQFQLL